MEKENYTPRTLQEAIVHYSNPDNALAFMIRLRWPDGITCPRCGSCEHSFLTTRRVWKCKGCKKQFSVKVGTIFEDSPLGLNTWLAAVWLITNAKNGVSSCEIARALGITQKSAWFVLHRIRIAMETGTIEKLKGQVEADETYIGGKYGNMHRIKRAQKEQGRGAVGKVIVMGFLERDGAVRAKVVKSIKKTILHAEVRLNVEAGTELLTDNLASYEGLEPEYTHESVNHAAEQYVRGHVHTNGIENFWSLLKRTLKGTYAQVESHHLQAYLDEQILRFNLRKGTDKSRFLRVVGGVSGKRLTYKQLIGRGGNI
ncbi:MAG: unclassified family transposase [Chlorobi bacterium]|nr:unclassified family transposase [Chlorobiota bacterium]